LKGVAPVKKEHEPKKKPREVEPPAKPETSIVERRRKKEKIAAEVAQELHGLRAVTQEVIDQLEIRVGAEIADLIRIFGNEEIAGEKHPLPPAQVETQLLARLRGLKVKPPKGRIKDLCRIAEILTEIRAVLNAPPAKGSRRK
jgi:hypothetical protein